MCFPCFTIKFELGKKRSLNFLAAVSHIVEYSLPKLRVDLSHLDLVPVQPAVVMVDGLRNFQIFRNVDQEIL